MTITAILGLGSNLEDPAQQLHRAFEALAKLPQSKLVSKSSLYKSAPQGPQDQPDFYNAAVAIETTLDPFDLLSELQAIESVLGRLKTRHWGERVIDLDIIFYAQLELAQPDLRIPHAEALNRDFVIVPILEIEPDWRLPDGSLLSEHIPPHKTHLLQRL